MSKPRCPVTGEPATRLVQWVDAGFLAALWRIACRTDARSSFAGQDRFGLWESPTGLYFFDPMLPGDHQFYTQFYDWMIARGMSFDAVRDNWRLAARRIEPGNRVLDVGCGWGSFRTVIPQAEYTGLDPHFAGTTPSVRGESLSDHLLEHAGSYDVVCAFEVLEHVAAPVELFAQMTRAVRPGGLIIISVPYVPSSMTRIPNFLLSAPPHHLTWWTERALRALAAGCGVSVESVEQARWTEIDSSTYWMARFSLIRCREIHYRHALWWHAAGVITFCVGVLAQAIKKVPKRADDGPMLVMVARKSTRTTADGRAES
jgi:SAM-dependent methyltransferase